MEHTQKTDVNNVVNQMKMIKFQGVFMAAWEMLKKEPVLLIALFLAPLVVTGILEAYVYPPLLGVTAAGGAIVSVVLAIVLSVVSALISFFGFGLIMRAASFVFDGKKLDVNAILAFVQKHFVDAIKLAIQLFIYTGAWIILAYLVVMTLAFPLSIGLAGMLTMLFPLAVIIYIVIFFKKLVNASMSYAIFWSADKPEIDGSLKKSLELCEGLTWTIFGNYVLIGIVGAIASAILVGILGAVLAVLGKAATTLAAAFASGVIGTFYTLFQYSLKGQVEKFRGGHHHAAPEHHAPTHHHTAS